jgi:hypothetical protein
MRILWSFTGAFDPGVFQSESKLIFLGSREFARLPFSAMGWAGIRFWSTGLGRSALR